MPQSFQTEIGKRTLVIETGRVAAQANGAVTVRYGDTVVLVTACMSAEPKEGVDFVRLTVDYEERFYAAGKIPGGFFRREGRPSQDAVLTSRLTDRPLRPLFPDGFRNEVQVVITVLSADQENDPDILSIIGASAALGISDIPFGGPISAVRIGYIDGQFVLNPTYTQLLESQLDLVVAGTKEMVIMLEAGANEVSEDIVLEAIKLGQESNQEVIKLQEELIQAWGKPKMEFERQEPNLELQAKVGFIIRDRLPQGTYWQDRSERETNLISLRAELLEKLGDSFPQEEILSALDSELKAQVRSSILETGLRPSGRRLTEIRPITCEVGNLPRTHGSGLFTRGETQVLTITTLGPPGEEQLIDSISQEESKHFMHHYNFPPFSTGEVRRIGSPGRREIGHGALTERALLPVLPSEDDFPYTIRLVSEVLSSNGSTSMASVCGGSLSLMDAGIPIKTPVAGVAMGLVLGADNKYALLTDIEGLEDAFGDMDFKVAGTANGITALQLDLKIKGISISIIGDALSQARQARLFILERIKETISTSRPELSKYAPKITKITIDPDKIRYVIGPGGRVIRSIMDETKVRIDVESDGTIIIGSPSEEATQRAIEIIEGLTREIEVGGIYTGKVTRVADFGAFVEILPGKEGLVRLSELADYHVSNVEEVAKVGDEIMVMVTGIDHLGRINLSRRAVFQKLSQIPGARVGPRPSGIPGRGRARPTRQPFNRGER
jgi:polyribonucleotide nucleotidyltransferase